MAGVINICNTRINGMARNGSMNFGTTDTRQMLNLLESIQRTETSQLLVLE